MGRLRALRGLGLSLVLGALLTGCTYVAYEPVNRYPDPSPGKAMVYFYRDVAFFGGYISYPVGEGNYRIGALAPGSYFFAEYPPGEYTFWVETETRDQVTIELEAGETYYISSHAELGILAPRPYIKVVDPKRGSKAVHASRYALATEP